MTSHGFTDPLDDLAASVCDRGSLDWPDVEPADDDARRRMTARPSA